MALPSLGFGLGFFFLRARVGFRAEQRSVLEGFSVYKIRCSGVCCWSVWKRKRRRAVWRLRKRCMNFYITELHYTTYLICLLFFVWSVV